MSVTPSQLTEIYKQLNESFISHPIISITPVQGDPPDQYDISYQIAGTSKASSGDVVESFGHSITLTIPFGFPLFPPSCKPKSELFHPDFDPAAICLGDQWDNEQSLPQLIIFIGKMINGEIYSTSNVFNQEARDWYIDHEDKYPLSDIPWTGSKAVTTSPEETEVDVLDDSDLTTDFDFHDLKIDSDNDQITIEESFPEVDTASSSPADLSPYYLLDSQKKFYTLQQALDESHFSNEETLSLSKKCSEKISEAQSFISQAQLHEKQGEIQLSLNFFEQAASLVSDFPSVTDDRDRLKQTLALLDDIGSDIPPPSAPSTPLSEKEVDHIESNKIESTAQNSVPDQEDAFFEKKKSSTKIILLTLGLLLTLIVSILTYSYYSIVANFNAAQELALQCSSQLDANQFKLTKISCTQGLALANKVKFLKQSEILPTKNRMTIILGSVKLKQGLAGKLLFEGKYLTKADAKRKQAIKETSEKAEYYYLSSQWQNAVSMFQSLEMLLKESASEEDSSIQNIRSKIALSLFKDIFSQAEQALKNNDWEMATVKIQKAFDLLKATPIEEQDIYSKELNRKLELCKFHIVMKQGDIAFSDARWLDAVKYYDNALEGIPPRNTILPETLSIITNNKKRAELYSTIGVANQAYSNGNWNRAISAYDQAEAFLVKNRELLSQKDSELSRKKLAKIRLQAIIVRDRQRATSLLTEDKLSSAREIYLQLVKNIEQSQFQLEEKLLTTKNDLNAQIQLLEEEIDKSDKIGFLTTNYQKLFISNYPAMSQENLSKPSIIFAKEIDGKQVFRMQCSAKGRGRPLTLVMFYAYNKTRGDWALYLEE